MAQTYEESLNQGVTKLNDEAQVLAENPLVKEISILVARELMKKSGGNAQELIRSGSVTGSLLDQVFTR